MIEFKARLTAPAANNKAFINVNYGGKNHAILGNPKGRKVKGSVLPNCTGGIHGFVIETIGDDSMLCRGNAENYWAYTKDGFPRSQTPQVGSIACWRKGKAGNSEDGAGHVVWVVDINSKGDFVGVDSAYYGSDGKGIIFRKRTFKRVNGTYSLGPEYRFQGFIHVWQPDKLVPVKNAVYRLYNPNSGFHFFTTNIGEANSLLRAGWGSETVGWKCPEKGTPVYRLYDKNTGDHLFTTSAAERKGLEALGWKHERIAFYSNTSKSVPVYRLYNRNSFEHFYTANSEERDALIRKGWKNERTAFYALKW